MNISVSLTPELICLIKAKVDSGRYTSTSEVVRAALRLLERADRQEVQRIKRFRRGWKAGIEGGDACEQDFASLRRTAHRELTARKKPALQVPQVRHAARARRDLIGSAKFVDPSVHSDAPSMCTSNERILRGIAS